MVLWCQCHHDVGIRCSDRRRIAVREINPAVRQSNIVDDAVDFGCRDLLPDRIFHEIAKESGVLNSHTRWPAQMKRETARIDGRKEILTKPRNNNGQRSEAGCEESRQKRTPMMETVL